jgi:hypothetical protein
MNVHLFILVAWFAVGVFCVIGLLWYMKTHEKQLLDEIPAAQIFGCIPPPFKWAVIIIFLFFGPVLLLWGLYEAIQESRKEKDENDVAGGPPVAATPPVVSPQSAWMVLFGLFGAALTAWIWASACPAKPLATFLEDQAKSIGFLLCIFVFLPAVLVRKRPLQGLRELSCVIPLYFVGLVAPVASMTVGWEGGWILGSAGAAAGAGAGAAAGWLFNRWTLPETENRPSVRGRVILLPIVFAVLFALYGAHNWASVWLTPDHAWAIGLFPLVFAFLGGLVGRPFLGMLTALPFVPLQLVPLVASMTVGWEGGWISGTAGAAAGAAAGAVNGWLYNRWIMPEYDKRRERERAVRPPGSTDGPGSSGSMAERS